MSAAATQTIPRDDAKVSRQYTFVESLRDWASVGGLSWERAQEMAGRYVRPRGSWRVGLVVAVRRDFAEVRWIQGTHGYVDLATCDTLPGELDMEAMRYVTGAEVAAGIRVVGVRFMVDGSTLSGNAGNEYDVSLSDGRVLRVTALSQAEAISNALNGGPRS